MLRKVITYGTFDLFHQGHYNIIKRARELGDYLIVGVTSESFDIERGKLNVRDSLMTRVENVRATGLVDEIIVEEYQGQKVHDIIKHNIDVFVVGSDWIGLFDYLKEYCEVCYLERTKHISSTKLRAHQDIYKVGIVTDEMNDRSFVAESKFISGLSVEKVYAEEPELAEEFCTRYQLAACTADLEDFYDGVDIVFLNVSPDKREVHLQAALEHKKHVICALPVVGDPAAMKRYAELAKQQEVLIIDNILTGYLRAFTQLIWMLRGGLIGDIVQVRCALAQKQFKKSKHLNDLLVYPLFVCLRLLGLDCEVLAHHRVRNCKKDITCEKILMRRGQIVADIEVSSLQEMKSEMTILGTKGRVEIPDDWWNMGYFEVHHSGVREKKRYSYNFDGTGLRYLLQEACIMIHDKRITTTRVFTEETVKISEILADLTKEEA